MVITSNLLAMNTQRMLGITSKNLKKRSEKLSSGYKVNRAADDTAGLAISEKMRRQIRGLNKSVENIQDGISLCQVADGALNEVHSILQRINELSVKAGNDTNTQEDREYIQEEIDALTGEIDRIANNTTFNEDIYPLLGRGDSSANVPENDNSSDDVSGSPSVPPLSDSDYPGSNLQIINASTISNYASSVDSDGITHYQLGSGTFKIEGLTNCVFEVSGNTCIEDTDLKNVTVDCSTGTVLSVKNVKIDNSANTDKVGNGIGAAIKFQGAGNTLNCFGYNEFNGGLDNHQQDPVACAGINVGGGAELTINGTDTSNLKAHGCSAGFLDSSINPMNYSYGIGCIGGGMGINITINGDTIDTYGEHNSLGGGVTSGVSSYDCTITINGGTVNATNNSTGFVAIGCNNSMFYSRMKNVLITINGGTVTATSLNQQGVGIGGFDSCGTINITGGTVTATAVGDRAAAIGTSSECQGGGTINITGGSVFAIAHEKSNAIGIGGMYSSRGSVDVYIDNLKTDASGTNDGNGHKIYSYPASSGGTGGAGGSIGNGSAADEGIWIHMATEAGVGIFISLVDATSKGIGIGELDVSSRENAGMVINSVKHALGKVSEYRTVFGAQQNRLEHAVNINQNIEENTTAAESRIRDTDIAAEIMEHTKDSILQQAGVSMLTQANQIPQYALQLLS